MAQATRRAPRRGAPQPKRSRPEKLLVLMIRMLQDRESKPFMSEVVQLQTSHTQHVFNRVYEKLSHALYRSDIVLMTVDPKLAARLQAQMDKNFQLLYDEIAHEDMRLDSLMEQEGVSGEVRYTGEKQEEAVIFSPRAKRFIMLMRTMDRVVNKIDLLHISGIIETTHAALAKWTWQKTVTRFANEIILSSNKALQQTRQSLVQRTEKERERMLEHVAAEGSAEGPGADAQTPAVDDKQKDMPAPHEIEQAMAHPIEDVEAIPEHDDDDGDVGQLAPKRAPRTAKLAAAGA